MIYYNLLVLFSQPINRTKVRLDESDQKDMKLNFSLMVAILVSLTIQASSECLHPKFGTVTGHTGCITVDTSQIVENGISAADKIAIVDKHNELRGSVGASNIQKMAWDDEVASIAQHWSDNCEYEHDDQRGIPGRFTVGQNLAIGYTSWTAVIQAWYDEINDFTLGGPNTGTAAVGHFTQVSWAVSSKIGCGYAQCSNLQTSQSNGRFYTCNYAPAGNVGGYDNPYTVSSGECGECASTCNAGLCDCGGKACENEGTLDPNTCECTCKSNYMPDICSLNCTIAKDISACGSSWDKSYCLTYANVPSDCPNLCSACPLGGVDYVESEDPDNDDDDDSGTASQFSVSYLGFTMLALMPYIFFTSA